jgi:putative Ig domain-containing protein/fibronectin type III domain protein
MHVFNVVGAIRTRRPALRALAACALLSSPWMVASAAPVLSGSPATSVVAAHYYAFQPGARDSVGKRITFSIANKPSWAVFSTTTGRLAGTPLPSNAGTFSNIVISGSDGTASTHLAAFSVTVLPLLNSPPRISGTPATAVVAGKAYAFQPSATDANGLSIKFGITGKPAWAAFDANTGRLSGTPAAANAGTYANIVITAYDGYMKGVLPAFSIVVQAAASTPTPVQTPVPPPVVTTGSATVSWTPPTENTDGSVLGNLAGYHIYYGSSPDNLNESVTVTNAGLTRYVLSGLATQTWYFSMTAYNSQGVESGRTAVETLIVQ